MKHPIGRTRNDVSVYIDLIRSQAAGYVSQQPRLLELIRGVLRQTTAQDPIIRIEQNMGRAIGYNFVVSTTDKDAIFYAQLIRDPLYTRFVKNGKPRTTKYLTIILNRDEDGEYELYDTWVGRLRPPRPGSDDETAESRAYWATHAFILDSQPIQSRTVTKTCPY
jgi:hypothetical protein